MGILISFIYINLKIIYFNIILRYLPLANSQIYVAWMGIGKSGNGNIFVLSALICTKNRYYSTNYEAQGTSFRFLECKGMT